MASARVGFAPLLSPNLAAQPREGIASPQRWPVGAIGTRRRTGSPRRRVGALAACVHCICRGRSRDIEVPALCVGDPVPSLCVGGNFSFRPHFVQAKGLTLCRRDFVFCSSDGAWIGGKSRPLCDLVGAVDCRDGQIFMCPVSAGVVCGTTGQIEDFREPRQRARRLTPRVGGLGGSMRFLGKLPQ
jgi:hypothetical protein